MADITNHHTQHGTWSLGFGGLRRFFAGFGEALDRAYASNSRMQELERLRNMSDAELAERGLQRDRIVHHVFRDLYYV